ncbi:MAG TPA: PHP domain-containing protein, partial [Tepidisphaeraceae bacterium]|nr:PHP domain-containing protein [Tepidisphaeraceae bacterium]
IEGGKLDGLKGIGAKKIEQLKQSISLRDQAGKRFGILEALRIGQLMLDEVKKIEGVDDAEVAGSLRRMKETVGDLDILVTLKPKANGSEVTAAFVTLPQVTHVLGQGPSKASVMTAIGLQVDLRVVPKENFGAALLYFTGSKEHNIRLRARAQSMGLTLNEWGLYNDDEWESAKSKTKSTVESILPTVKALASKSEESVYKALGLSYIEPELREDRGEVALAEAKKLPKLIEISDIKGELHCHTTASDGEHSIEQMAARAKEIGYSYIVITDHSKSQVVARGLEAERLVKQIEQVRKISASIPDFTILIGSEVDILSDGALDYPDDLLKELDFVVASPHVALRQDMAKATERILRAIDNKYVNVIGHPTGRLINQRSGLEYDWTRVFKAATANGTALEINASYPRLDLTDLAARAAIDAGVMLSIDTDAHSVDSLPEIALGVAIARRAGATKAHILNCQPLDTLRKWVKSKRDR